VLITSALPYVNNVPHLGNIVGCVLSADCFARFARARGHNALFVCGTDEYGTATETKALAEGTTCAAVCDRYHALHAGVYAWFGIAFDRFGRTPTWQQTAIAQAIFTDLEAGGLLQAEAVQQLYSEAAGTFLADRFVEGTCPKCAFPDARGDQCDGCGSLLNPTELVHPRCKLTGTVPVVRTSTHIFLDLPSLTPDLAAYHAAAAAAGGWSANCVQTTGAWMRDGLRPRCITRDLKWGTPVPGCGPGAGKVFYVWFDAPIGYISITAGLGPGVWEAWWKAGGGGGGGASGAGADVAGAPKKGDSSPEVELVQFMGKDNTAFHTVIFPATLLGTARAGAAGVDGSAKPDTPAAAVPRPRAGGWTLMKAISVTEYLTFEGGKFSKSRGAGVFGDDAASTGVPADVWRYYLLSGRPEASDTDFKWADLAARCNGELLANLGNFCHRSLSFAAARLGGVVPPVAAPGSEAAAAVAGLTAAVAPILAAYIAAMEAVKIREGARLLLAASAAGNKFLQDAAPWAVLKTDPAAAGGLIRGALGLVALLSGMAAPFVPTAAAGMAAQVGLAGGAPFSLDDGAVAAASADLASLLATGTPLGTPAVLFNPISKEEEESLRVRFGGGMQADVGAVGAAAAAPKVGPGAAGAGAPAPAQAAKAPKAPKPPKAAAAAADPAAPPPDISRLALRVGVVTKAWKHPEADALYCEEVDLGDGGGATRQVVSGLVKHIPLDAFVGSRVVCVTNVKPVAMRGQASNAMVLAATGGDGRVELVTPPAGAAPGAVVSVAGFPADSPDAEVNLKKSPVWPAVAAELATDGAGVATYRGVPLEVAGVGVCAAATVGGGKVG
jgi:methionyl-tRNA synthetase